MFALLNPYFFSAFKQSSLVAVLKRGLLLFISLLTLTVQAQSKKELEKKKQQIQQDIENTNRLLSQTRQNKSSSLNQLVTLNKQISFRNELIQTINGEIVSVDNQIGRASCRERV